VTSTPRRPKTAINVLVVAPDNMTAELLTNAFSRGRNNFAVTTLIGSSESVIVQLTHCKSDVALISEELEDGAQAGFKILQRISGCNNGTATIMLLKSSQPDAVLDALREGARGVFYRNASLKALSKCIRTVHLGQLWVGNEDVQHLVNALHARKPIRLTGADKTPLLTGREEDVVRLVTDGMRNRDIAEQLGVTEHSVRNYLYRIFEKLGVSTRVELILYVFSQRNAAVGL
jgi:two-component system, NarL family, nitrate/nitrite response regulator NarL